MLNFDNQVVGWEYKAPVPSIITLGTSKVATEFTIGLTLTDLLKTMGTPTKVENRIKPRITLSISEL